MTTTDRAVQAMEIACCGGCCGSCDFPRLAAALATEGLLAPEPRIIHTLTGLESIDPDTILIDSAGPYTADHAVAAIYDEAYEARAFLPAVVIAAGDHVRAARQTLEAADATD